MTSRLNLNSNFFKKWDNLREKIDYTQILDSYIKIINNYIKILNNYTVINCEKKTMNQIVRPDDSDCPFLENRTLWVTVEKNTQEC